MFWYLRVSVLYLVAALITLLCFIPVLVLHIFNAPYKYKYFIGEIYSILLIKAAQWICGLKYQVLGLEKLPKGPAVVMANHQSFWENVFMQLIIPKHSWVIKKELLDIPIFGWGLKMVDPIAVDRTNNTSVNQITKVGRKKIDQGLWMIIFPEATRVKPNEYRKYKPSGTKLAMDNNIPIVLIAHNSGLVWPKAVWIKKPGTITVKVVSVIDTSEFANTDVRSLTQKIEKQINYEKDLLAQIDLE